MVNKKREMEIRKEERERRWGEGGREKVSQERSVGAGGSEVHPWLYTQTHKRTHTHTHRHARAGEMAQWVKALAIKPKDLSLIPGTHMDRRTGCSLTFACIS